MRIRNHFRLRPTQVPQEHRVAQVAAANPWRSQYESAGCHSDRVLRASRHTHSQTPVWCVRTRSPMSKRFRGHPCPTPGAGQTGPRRPGCAGKPAQRARMAPVCGLLPQLRPDFVTRANRPKTTLPDTPQSVSQKGVRGKLVSDTVNHHFTVLHKVHSESARQVLRICRGLLRSHTVAGTGSGSPTWTPHPESAGSFVRASTNATSEAAIVAGSSWSPAARTAIATPSPEGSPKSLGSNAMALLVPAPARLDSRRSASRLASASVSIARRSRRMSSASLSRTRSF